MAIIDRRAFWRHPSLRHVFITHHHSDQNADYGNLIWLAWTAGLSTRIDARGPPPLERMTKLFFAMNAYDIDTSPRRSFARSPAACCSRNPEYTFPMMRPCTPADAAQILEVINDGADAYRGVIPPDCWHDPYMAESELQRELAAGVRFWCVEDDGRIDAVMGIQDVLDVALIRHAYTRTSTQGRGLGSRLLAHLRDTTDRRILIGTWAAASWAVRFYQGRGFELVTPIDKERLLKRYWTVSDRQITESVVLRSSAP